MSGEFSIGPEDELAYKFDFAPKTNGTGVKDWLSQGERISSWVLTMSSGMTPATGTLDDGGTSVGFMAIPTVESGDEWVDCAIVTDAEPPQKLKRRMRFKVSNSAGF